MYDMCFVRADGKVFVVVYKLFFFFFKQKTAYEMRISDWSSDVCSSDLHVKPAEGLDRHCDRRLRGRRICHVERQGDHATAERLRHRQIGRASCRERVCQYV